MTLIPATGGKPQHLGTAKIWNDATGDLRSGNYQATLSVRGISNQVWKKGMVKGFARKRLKAWDLLYRVLEDIVGSRNASAA